MYLNLTNNPIFYKDIRNFQLETYPVSGLGILNS